MTDDPPPPIVRGRTLAGQIVNPTKLEPPDLSEAVNAVLAVRRDRAWFLQTQPPMDVVEKIERAISKLDISKNIREQVKDHAAADAYIAEARTLLCGLLFEI